MSSMCCLFGVAINGVKVLLNNDKKIMVISFGLRPEEEREGPEIEMAVGCRAATFHGEES